jgi:anthranilate synthase/aminodeoxychorismate synthase-like glutamine amidotransferase
VFRNDAIDRDRVAALAPEAIVISPGPCTPHEAGRSIEIIQGFSGQIPMLGICLGHQALVQAFGGKIVSANEPMHGRESEIQHFGTEMFENIPSPFLAGRYHSLVAEKQSLPSCFEITARSEDFSIMAVEHRTLPLVGLQFHPESILSPCGSQLIHNFLAIAGIANRLVKS